MEFLEKLNLLMQEYGLNRRSLSQNCGIPYTTVMAWYKKGYEGLKITTLRKLSDYFDISLDYWFSDDITDSDDKTLSKFKINYDEMEHIKKYRSLDSYGRETINLLLDRETERAAVLKKKDTHITELEANSSTIISFKKPSGTSDRSINYFYSASAGTGQVIFDDVYTEHITIPDIPEYRRVAYAVKVSGNSMEPLYRDSDMLLIEPGCSIRAGEIGIFNVDGNAYVKKLGDGELISINSSYGNIPLTENSRCMGRVVDKYVSPELDAAMNIGKSMLEEAKKAKELADDLIG